MDVEYIKARRLALGLTQATAAKLAGFPNLQKWSQLETGSIRDPRLATLETVARVLKCKIDRLSRKSTASSSRRTRP